jgi:hypothetical protein
MSQTNGGNLPTDPELKFRSQPDSPAPVIHTRWFAR